MELLAPAGDRAALEAALEAGADAVYFGLTVLNARRRARNFRQDEIGPAVAAVHARGAKAYLTLNIDLAQRELGQAARILELARQSGIDAVLVRDPALLALGKHYPELALHLSTQTGVTCSADVAVAAEWGASRVVLAREMTLQEIAAASAVPGIETEAFVQGALCFCISGRCLLSSWIGGHSGNRGACTSPCRVPWTVADQPVGTPFSMRDLSAVGRLRALRRAGVAALKIEGRLKNAEWVRQAVGLYRQALDGDCPDFRGEPAPAGQKTRAGRENGTVPLGSEEALANAAPLGAYTGRQLTCGYLDAERDELTGVAGRESGLPTEGEADAGAMGEAEEDSQAEPPADELPGATYEFSMTVQPRGITCQCRCGGGAIEWSIPKTVVRRTHKAATIGQVLEWLGASPMSGYRLTAGTTNEPDFLLVPWAVNALAARIGAALRQAQKAPDELVRIELPPAVRAALEKTEPHRANTRTLGQQPNRVRLGAKQLAAFIRQVRPEAAIVEGLTAASLDGATAASRGVPLVAALPSVLFESDLAPLGDLLGACAAAGVAVEVNSWGGWWLARKSGVALEAGPGLAVLNALAAQVLAEAGARAVTLSPEADRRQLEDLTAQCTAPCSLVVFGRPALMLSRVRLPDEFVGKVCRDRRGMEMVPRRQGGLCVFRPVEPYDLRGTTNERIRVRHLVVDLVGSEDPVGDWFDMPLGNAKMFRFNYDRMLA